MHFGGTQDIHMSKSHRESEPPCSAVDEEDWEGSIQAGNDSNPSSSSVKGPDTTGLLALTQ